ncbi:MAG: DUF6299 family protein [Solirubrobacteraceae bacterium]
MNRGRRLLLTAAFVCAGSAVVSVGTAWAASPSNDTFSGATVVSSLPFGTTEDTAGATLDDADTAAGSVCPVSPGFTFSSSVWFSYTPSSDQAVKIDPSGSSYGVAGAVLTGTPSSFSAQSCFLSGTTVQVSAGTTYYIDLLESPAGSGGTLSLSMSRSLPPNPLVTVDPSGTFDPKSGAATVSGTASCSAGANGFLFGSLSQSIGRIATVFGDLSPSSSIVCDGTPHPWSVVVTPWSGLFKGGHANAAVTLSACSFTCEDRKVTQTIQLKN